MALGVTAAGAPGVYASLEDLVRRSESEMLKFRNFGRKSLNELNAILSELGLSFGMDVEKYSTSTYGVA